MAADDGGGWVLTAQDDAWLGRQLNRPALRLDLGDQGDDCQLRRRLASDAIFATAKVPTADVRRLRFFENAGCRVVDVGLTFTADAGTLRQCRADIPVRQAGQADSASTQTVAATAFRFSRFHLDDAVPNDLANAVKKAWVANYFTGGRGSSMLVAEDAQGICGFLQGLEQGDTAVIDLIAVAPRAVGRGIGTALTIGFAHTPLRDGVLPSRLMVGTQAANIPAIRLYERLNFTMTASAYVLHHHGGGKAADFA